MTDQSLVEEIVPSTRPTIEVMESTDTYGKVIVEPLERGFGVTLGNALRRVLLSSLPGAAITSVRIDGVQHEFSTLPHVKEDVSELSLNIKAIRIKRMADRPGSLRLDVQGPGQVMAGDVQPSADFEIVNPEQYLASLDSPEGRLSMEFQVEIGKGYVPATHTEGMPIGVLPVDAIFTPVTRVNYNVEKTRVGQVTNYDRLVLEVWTDGTKSPVEAVRESGQVLVDSFFQFVTIGQIAEGTQERPSLSQAIPADQYNMPIERLNLSARTLNCLKRAKINRVGEVLEKSHDELLKIKNFGDKSLAELYDRLRALGLLSQIRGAESKVESERHLDADAEEEPTSIGAAPQTRMASEPERERTGRGSLRDLAALRALLGDESAQSGGDGREVNRK
ncbi:MAG: DNA-directed polymerase subunit alpha [Dehalococcoidia bacterium]|nr:DNA-directed polymerase subunit alpha [Dehalococcoidia bacterium]